jgi:hypothetical protein
MRTLVAVLAALACLIAWSAATPREARAVAPAVAVAGPVAASAVGAALKPVIKDIARKIPGVKRIPGLGKKKPKPGRSAGARAGMAAGGAGVLLAEALSPVGISDGAGWLIRESVTMLDRSARVDLEAGWFQQHYRMMVALGAFLLLPLLLLSLTTALMRGDWSAMARACFVWLPAAVLLTSAVVAITQAGLASVDALSSDLADDVSTQAADLAVVAGGVGAIAQVPGLVAILVGLIMCMAALAVWVELILRAGAIYVAVGFAPLFFAAMVWPAIAGWARELARLLVALVLSKFVIVSVLSLGLAAMTGFGLEGGVSQLLAGAAIFGLAAFAPFVLLALIPLAGGLGASLGVQARSAISHAGGMQSAWQAVQRRLKPDAQAPPAGGVATAAALAGGPAVGRPSHGGRGSAGGDWNRARAQGAGTVGSTAPEPVSDPGWASGPGASASLDAAGPATSGPSSGGPAAIRVPDAVAARIVAAAATGQTAAAIARSLDAEGIPTPRGAARWSPSTVRAVIARQRNSGAYVAPPPAAGPRIDPPHTEERS